MGEDRPEGWPWYKCVEEPRFKQEIEREFGNHRAWDDISRLIQEDILRAPGEFPHIPGTDYHFARIPVVPPRILVFRVDAIAQIVYYKAVRRTGVG